VVSPEMNCGTQLINLFELAKHTEPMARRKLFPISVWNSAAERPRYVGHATRSECMYQMYQI
jgi:hypothetical protein